MKQIFELPLKKKMILGGVLGAGWVLWVFIPAYSPSLGSFLFLPPLVLVSLFVWAGFMLFGLYAVIGMCVLFKKSAKEALLPVLVCAVSILLGNQMETLGTHVRLDTFRTALPEFNRQVRLIEDDLLTNEGTDKKVYGFHALDEFSVEALGDPFAVYAYYETNGLLTIRFLHGISMQSHHRGFLYRSDGQLEAALGDGEWIQSRINSNWCTIGNTTDLSIEP